MVIQHVVFEPIRNAWPFLHANVAIVYIWETCSCRLWELFPFSFLDSFSPSLILTAPRMSAEPETL